MRNLIRIFFEGTYQNLKRIFFASDRLTDMELRNAILNGEVEPERKVAEDACIGCGGCANVCPTNAIEMKKLNSAEWITSTWSKNEVPELNSLRCVNCYHCHDFCPVYALYSKPGTIHPNAVGDLEVNVSEFIDEPIKVSDDKIKYISQYLSDETILKNKKSK